MLRRKATRSALCGLLSLLGSQRYKGKYPGGAPGQLPDTTPGSVLFDQTGKRLGGTFLRYWHDNGGLAQQGYPISDPFTEVNELDGKPYSVQYFERAVFEYHPENSLPHDVLLSQLGSTGSPRNTVRNNRSGGPGLTTVRKLITGATLLALLAVYGCGATPATETPATSGQTQQATNTPAPAPPQATATQAPGGATSVPTPWVPPTALAGTPIPGAEATLTAAPELKRITIVLTNSQGEQFNMTVEVADTPANQELGLMFRPSVPPDAGMLFDFGGDTNEGFWMANTILPLSIAFIKADGTIQDILDMQPLDRNTTSASGPYHYALETNQGYFRAHNLQKGDHVLIPSAQGMVLPGMPSCP